MFCSVMDSQDSNEKFLYVMNELAWKANCKLIICPWTENRNDRWIQVGAGADLEKESGRPKPRPFTLALRKRPEQIPHRPWLGLERPGQPACQDSEGVGGKAPLGGGTPAGPDRHPKGLTFTSAPGSCSPQVLGEISHPALTQAWGDQSILKGGHCGLFSSLSQDEIEFGYIEAPHKSFPVVLDSPRNRGLKDFPYDKILVCGKGQSGEPPGGSSCRTLQSVLPCPGP